MHSTSPFCAEARRPWRLAAAITLGLSATAVAGAAAPRPDPLDPQAPVPPARHDSVLQRHRGSAAEVKVGDWKAAMDTVTRIGGWRAYLREATQPDTPATGAPGSRPTGPHRH